MPHHLRRRLLQAAALSIAAAGGATRAAHAQGVSAVRLVLGFPPGGGIDVMTRQIAEQLRARQGWATTVENRTGGSGRIAIEVVKSAAAEPVSVLVTPIEILTLLPHLYKRVSFDPFKDFAPLAGLAENPYAIAVSAKSEFATLADLVRWCAARPAEASYGTPGEGTPQHLLGQALAKAAGIQLTHIGYKGGPPAIQDMLGGQIPAVIATYSALAAQRAAGQIRVLAHSGAQRTPLIPGVPTFAESGYAAVTAESSFIALCSTSVRPDVAAQLSQALQDVVRTEAFGQIVARMGQRPLPLEPAALQAHMRDNHAYWRDVVRTSGLQLTD